MSNNTTNPNTEAMKARVASIINANNAALLPSFSKMLALETNLSAGVCNTLMEAATKDMIARKKPVRANARSANLASIDDAAAASAVQSMKQHLGITG